MGKPFAGHFKNQNVLFDPAATRGAGRASPTGVPRLPHPSGDARHSAVNVIARWPQADAASPQPTDCPVSWIATAVLPPRDDIQDFFSSLPWLNGSIVFYWLGGWSIIAAKSQLQH
jgi:hypothetical protein